MAILYIGQKSRNNRPLWSRSLLPDQSQKFCLGKRLCSILPCVLGLGAAWAGADDQKISVVGHAFRDSAALFDDRILGLIAGQAVELASEGESLPLQATARAL